MPQRIIDWLAHSISCVLITPFGWPVEPEVNSILAMVSGPTLACADFDGGGRLRRGEIGKQRRLPVPAEGSP